MRGERHSERSEEDPTRMRAPRRLADVASLATSETRLLNCASLYTSAIGQYRKR